MLLRAHLKETETHNRLPHPLALTGSPLFLLLCSLSLRCQSWAADVSTGGGRTHDQLISVFCPVMILSHFLSAAERSFFDKG